MSRKSNKARELRRDPSRAERKCWELIRAHRMEADACRTAVIESLGWRVVRFDAFEANPEGIWTAIQDLISEGVQPPLLASPPSGEEHEGERLQ